MAIFEAFFVFAKSDAFDEAGVVEDFMEIFEVDEAEVFEIAATIAELAVGEDEVAEGGEVVAVGGEVLAVVGEATVVIANVVAEFDEMADDGGFGDGVSGVATFIIDDAVHGANGVVEVGAAGAGDDEMADLVLIADDTILELGDGFVGVGFGERINAEFGGGAGAVGEDVDGGELGFEGFEIADGDDAGFAGEIVVGVETDGGAPTDAFGDSAEEKEEGIANDFVVFLIGGEEQKKLVVVGFEFGGETFDFGEADFEVMAELAEGDFVALGFGKFFFGGDGGLDGMDGWWCVWFLSLRFGHSILL